MYIDVITSPHDCTIVILYVVNFTATFGWPCVSSGALPRFSRPVMQALDVQSKYS